VPSFFSATIAQFAGFVVFPLRIASSHIIAPKAGREQRGPETTEKQDSLDHGPRWRNRSALASCRWSKRLTGNVYAVNLC
jgi:hypothetical protein